MLGHFLQKTSKKFLHQLVCYKKNQLRKKIQRTRRNLTPDIIKNESSRILKHIVDETWFKNANTIALYFPITNEVDLTNLLKYDNSKTWLLPSCIGDEMVFYRYEGDNSLKRGKYGIVESTGSRWDDGMDVVFIPGVAFDRFKNRLGRGAGFYDKWLALHRNVLKIGICYDFQLVSSRLPINEHDIPMDAVIHPNGILI